MRGLVSFILDILVPPRRTEVLVRTLTLEQLQHLGDEDGLPYHDARVQALVWELKYYAARRPAQLAGEYFSEQLLSVAAEELGVPLLIPVPMHPHRRRMRGHNQTETLCTAALPFVGNAVEYKPYLLRRVIDTPTQQGLPRAVRLNNVQQAMQAAHPEEIAGRSCIVVDDVTTTGATLQEAKRALKAAGAQAVHTLALARS